MRHFIILGTALAGALALSGCDKIHLPWQQAPKPGTVTPPQVGPISPGIAATPSSLDATTAAQKKAALDSGPGTAKRRLGETVASLGSPARQGFWLRTGLVTKDEKGRIEVSGRKLAADLLPSGGAKDGGSQLSLAAFRALGLDLTDLPKLTVYGP